MAYGFFSIVTAIFHALCPNWKKYLLFCSIPYLIFGTYSFLFIYFTQFKPKDELDLPTMTLKNYVISEKNIVQKKGGIVGLFKNRTYRWNWIIFTIIYRINIF